MITKTADTKEITEIETMIGTDMITTVTEKGTGPETMTEAIADTTTRGMTEDTGAEGMTIDMTEMTEEIEKGDQTIRNRDHQEKIHMRGFRRSFY